MKAKIRRPRRRDQYRRQRRAEIKKRLQRCRRRIQRRLQKKQWAEQRHRMFKDQNLHYEVSKKTRGVR